MPQGIPRLVAFLALGWATAHAAVPAPPEPAKDDAANFFRRPDFDAPVVSPDGASVAFIAWHKGHSRLFKLDLATGKMDGVFDPGDGEVERAWWLGSRRLLIAGRGEFGFKYFVQELDGGKPRVVSTLDYVPPDRITAVPNDAEHVVAVKYLRGWYVTRVEVLADRGRQLDATIYDPDRVVLSAGGEIRAKIYQWEDRWRVFWRASAADPWQDLEGTGAEPPFWPLAVAANDRDLLVLAHDQGDTTALMVLDPASGQRTVLAQRPNRDIFRLIFEQPSHFPVGVSFFNLGHDDLFFFDDNAAKLHAGLTQALPETYRRVASASLDHRVQIIQAWNPGLPSRYYLFDTARGRLSKLEQQFANDSLPPLGTVRFFEFTTRDGVHESGYLLLPHPSRAAPPCPLLIVPVDYVGQEGDLADGFLAWDQYLASRGIAVASIMARGSRGWGKTFQKAGDFKLADVVTHDYEDALDFLVHEGLIDPARVAITGNGMSALFALRMASISHALKAVVAWDAAAYGLNAAEIDWFTGRGGDLGSIVEQAGGSRAAYSLVREFEPEQFVANLSAHALIIYTSSYDGIFRQIDAGVLHDTLQKHKKTFEWYLFDLHDFEHRPESYYQAVFATKVADYLTTTLKVSPPKAAVGK